MPSEHFFCHLSAGDRWIGAVLRYSYEYRARCTAPAGGTVRYSYSAFVPYAACDLEISYRNAAGIIPKEYLVQREIQRITPEIRLSCFTTTLQPSTPAIGRVRLGNIAPKCCRYNTEGIPRAKRDKANSSRNQTFFVLHNNAAALNPCHMPRATWKYRTEILPVHYRRNPSCNARYSE